MVAIVVLVRVLSLLVERSFNKVTMPPPYQAGEEARELHEQLFVADLHADPLLWNRKLLKRHSHSHVDLPRLIDGNVALQVCAAVTRIPWKANFERTANVSDAITTLIITRGWPPRTWTSLLQRALYQAQNLNRCVARSQGRLVLVKNVRELDELLARREASPKRTPVGAMLALEGVHALQGDLDNLDLLYDVGFRIIGLSHFFDNEAGGSAHGVDKGGLTPFGRELVQRVQEKRMLIDLAHASPRVIDDVLEMASAPVIVSHTGLRGTCDNTRNLSDEHARGIAANGGVMGIGMFEMTVCGTSIEDTARAIRYGADLAGADYFASGSDFDGLVTTPIDASGLALLTEALINQGFTREEIAKIMGNNTLRVLRQVLPS